MINAMWVSALVGAGCAALSVYLMLRGWSLIGDTISHAVVPGVTAAYVLGFPFSLGAFIAGGLAGVSVLLLSQNARLKADVTLGITLSSFFAIGLFINSLNPASIDISTVVMGNILAISYFDILQLVIIEVVLFLVIAVTWKDLMVIFFDEGYARSIGLRVSTLKMVFFALLCACMVAAMQAVGALLILSMVVTPGASAYLLSNRFVNLLQISVVIGSVTGFLGAYVSYFLNGATGGAIVVLQTAVFLTIFLISMRTRTVC